MIYKSHGLWGGLAHCEHTRSEYNPILGDEDEEGKEKNGDTPLARQLEKGEATSGLSGIVDKGTVLQSFFSPGFPFFSLFLSLSI